MREQLTVGSLFAGIGGFDLGLERAGMRVIWQSEIDPYACAVLRKHWPAVPNLGDIQGIDSAAERPDVVCGGFPCQDISNAGKRAGIDGERSGLWGEFARVIGELRPRYVIVENVAALLGRGIERVLGDLAALGFDAEWHCIPASAVGAPHRRDRVWIVAYAECTERRPLAERRHEPDGDDPGREETPSRIGAGGEDVAYANGAGLEIGSLLAGVLRREGSADAWQAAVLGGWWDLEPNVGRVAHGIPARVDRLRCLGNAIVPQIAEIIGRAIIEAEG